MAFYLVRATPREDRLEELAEKLSSDAFIDMEPFGRALTRGLCGVRRMDDGRAVWEEEDYCDPPLKQERAAVLDRFFRHIEVEAVDEGEGWKRIAPLPKIFPDTCQASDRK